MRTLAVIAGALSAIFACCHAQGLTAVFVTKPQGCTWNGTLYQVGDSIHKSPCEPCQCGQNGQIICAIVDCFFTMCVDAVHDPSHCCPTCPNGANCYAPDGVTIIKQGETYHPDKYTSCTCQMHGFGGNTAMCAHLAPQPDQVVS